MLRRDRVRYLTQLATLAAVYYGVGRLGLAAGALKGNVTPVWPPTGVSIAALLLFGYRLWPGVTAGALLVNGLSAVPFLTACGMSAGNTLEALLGAALLYSVNVRLELDRVRDVIALTAFAAAVATTVSATVGVVSLRLGGVIPAAAMLSTWRVWWVGDALGALLVIPVFLALRPPGRAALRRQVAGEAVVVSIAAATLTWVTFSGNFDHPYVVFPFIIWAALRGRLIGVATLTLLISAIAVLGTRGGHGDFSGGTPTQNLWMLDTYLAVVALTGLVLAAVVAERDHASAHNAELQARMDADAELSRQSHALAASEARYRALIDHQPGSGVLLLDRDLRVLTVGGTLLASRGYPSDAVVGRLVEDVLPQRDATTLLPRYQAALRGEATVGLDFLPVSGGANYLVDVVPLDYDTGVVEHVLVAIRDVTMLKRIEKQLEQLANHDPLTGLLNRRGFEVELERQASFVARYGAAGALLVLDLDHFKEVNDTLGHGAGDQLIASMGALLKRTVRDTDIVARLGGDEFAVILPQDGRHEAEIVAEKILQAARAEVTMLDGRHPRTVTASIGIALFDNPDLTGEDVLIGADVSMYSAKEAGRDGFATFTAGSAGTLSATTHIGWVDRISAALHDDRFALYAQPILDLTANRVDRYELLLRLIDESGRVIEPSMFLPVAERAGLIGRIDRWVTNRAIELLSNPALPVDIVLEVNLSALSVGDLPLLAYIEERLEATGVDASRLIFEVTETAAVSNLDRARSFVERLAGLGCLFAIDDFGAGFGNFYYLKHLPFDFIKIDGEFVSMCAQSPTDQVVISALVNVARGLQKKTIAEFVEDADTLRLLRAQGVDYAQGYFIGEAAPVEHLLAGVSTRLLA